MIKPMICPGEGAPPPALPGTISARAAFYRARISPLSWGYPATQSTGSVPYVSSLSLSARLRIFPAASLGCLRVVADSPHSTACASHTFRPPGFVSCGARGPVWGLGLLFGGPGQWARPAIAILCSCAFSPGTKGHPGGSKPDGEQADASSSSPANEPKLEGTHPFFFSPSSCSFPWFGFPVQQCMRQCGVRESLPSSLYLYFFSFQHPGQWDIYSTGGSSGMTTGTAAGLNFISHVTFLRPALKCPEETP
ncbi:hypothetical protein OF83DRAFT_45866 [Amylostereum chailletii]|nr:hypothetical protein OF83DRAFT_45866 [Amylostereum chailletii]